MFTRHIRESINEVCAIICFLILCLAGAGNSNYDDDGMKKYIVAAVLIAAPTAAYFEGVSLTTYLDPIGKPTICYGHTETAKEIRVRTQDECTKLLLKELEGFAHQVDRLVKPEVHPNTLAAYTSFAYNVGMGNFKRSTLLRKANAGDIEGSCDELLRWNRAGGKVLRGLTKRREAERALCLSF